MLLFALLLRFINGLGDDSAAEGKAQLETSLRRATVSYFVSEGVYPPDLDSILSRYAIQLDSERYSVFYDCFAANIMPDITVVEK